MGILQKKREKKKIKLAFYGVLGHCEWNVPNQTQKWAYEWLLIGHLYTTKAQRCFKDIITSRRNSRVSLSWERLSDVLRGRARLQNKINVYLTYEEYFHGYVWIMINYWPHYKLVVYNIVFDECTTVYINYWRCIFIFLLYLCRTHDYAEWCIGIKLAKVVNRSIVWSYHYF